MRFKKSGFSAALVLLPVLSIFAGGCTSLKGERLGQLADGNDVKPSGIPYMLVRPEFLISRGSATENGKAGKYTLAVAYEPDPSKLYTIRLDSATFTDINFVLKLGAGGVITSMSSTTTEQLTPAITALGSFSEKLIGALAKVVFDKDSLRNSAASEVEEASKSESACKANSDVVISALLVQRPPSAMPTSIGEVLVYRIKHFKDDDQFVGSFHYVSAAELACLSVVRDQIDKRRLKTSEPIKKDFDEAVENHIKTYESDSLLLLALKRAVDDYDTERIKNAKESLDIRMNELHNGTPEQVTQADKLDKIVAKAKNAADSVVVTKTAKVFVELVDMDASVWLARHVLYLERELSDIQMEVLKRPTVPVSVEVQNRRKELEEARADTLNVRPLYARSVVLSEFLKAVPTKTEKGGSAPATAEYIAIRGELDAVLAQIDARRSRVLSDGKPVATPGPGPLDSVRVKLIDAKTVETINKTGWPDGTGKDADDYVIVLEEAK